MILGWKLSAALCTGNTVVIKPSEFTPLTANKIAELSVTAGFPAGVINVVQGARTTGSALTHHNLVKLVAVTGSEIAGRAMLEASAKSNLKRESHI